MLLGKSFRSCSWGLAVGMRFGRGLRRIAGLSWRYSHYLWSYCSTDRACKHERPFLWCVFFDSTALENWATFDLSDGACQPPSRNSSPKTRSRSNLGDFLALILALHTSKKFPCSRYLPSLCLGQHLFAPVMTLFNCIFICLLTDPMANVKNLKVYWGWYWSRWK